LEFLPTAEEEQVTQDQVSAAPAEVMQMLTVAATVVTVATEIKAALATQVKTKVAVEPAAILVMVAKVQETIQTIKLPVQVVAVVAAPMAAPEKLAAAAVVA
jgi:hypothetical protein